MRDLALNEINEVAGGLVGDVVVYDFALKPGVEVVGMEQVCVGYITDTWTETGFWGDKTTYIIDTPIYDYYPIYAETVTYIY